MVDNHFQMLSDLDSNVIQLGLEPIKKILQRIGNPQRSYPSILIGGTNGKGSIAAMLSSILQESGFRVGLYTSPHLIDVRERISINRTMIPEERMAECIGTIRSHLDRPLTYFELLTAAAYHYFFQEKIDIAVLEVGMGGRLDATNVVTPLLSVISNVHLDHQNYLGRYLKDIAFEKAGIIKENRVCLTAASQKSVLDVLSGVCRRKGATLYRLGKDIRVRSERSAFSYSGLGLKIQNLHCPLWGNHQLKNAALALASAEIINSQGLVVDERAMVRGVANTIWEGRLELLQTHPQVLLDGAHNPAGISALCNALHRLSECRRRILIFGVLADKNYPIMLKRLLPFFDSVIFTTPKTERAVDLSELIKVTRSQGRLAEAIQDAGTALQRALFLARKEDLICVSGSLYLVGEIKKLHAETKKVAGDSLKSILN